MRPLARPHAAVVRVLIGFGFPAALSAGLLGPCLIVPVLFGVSDEARLAADVRTAALEEGCLVRGWDPMDREPHLAYVEVRLQCPGGPRDVEWLLGWEGGRWRRAGLTAP